MKSERVNELISKFNSQQINTDEQRELEMLIESGDVDLELLSEISHVTEQLAKVDFPAPSKNLDERFYELLQKEGKFAQSFSWTSLFNWADVAPKLAFASVALIIGLAIGFILKPSNTNEEQLVALSQQVTDLKEMMLLSLLEKESATERLRAVSLTNEMEAASSKVTEALIQTLNMDENVNVRLAALEALKPYVSDSALRAELIRSIGKQNSPLVQMALAELMAQIQERGSVKELQKILESERTPKEVKSRIKESIKVLS